MTTEIPLKVLGFTQLTVSSSIVTLADCDDADLITEGGLVKVEIQVDPAGGNVRMTKDGSTDPVGATTGVRMDAGDIFELDSVEAKDVKFIYDASTDAELQCHFYGSEV